jgi:hypothetical protein
MNSSALALLGSAIPLVLFTGVWSQAPAARHAAEATKRPPTLNISAAGDFQQAVHFNFESGEGIFRQRSFVAPLHALVVSPQDWVRIYTNSPLGPPRTARARIYSSAPPERCFGNVMIGCVKVETAGSRGETPLHPEVAAGFGFVAPSAPGSYWIALQADWGFGATTQAFVIDVRA